MNEREKEELRDLKNRVNRLQYDFDKLKNAILFLPEIGDKVQKGMWSGLFQTGNTTQGNHPRENLNPKHYVKQRKGVDS